MHTRVPRSASELAGAELLPPACCPSCCLETRRRSPSTGWANRVLQPNGGTGDSRWLSLGQTSSWSDNCPIPDMVTCVPLVFSHRWPQELVKRVEFGFWRWKGFLR